MSLAQLKPDPSPPTARMRGTAAQDTALAPIARWRRHRVSYLLAGAGVLLAAPAWDQRVISERDYQRSIDDVSTARLNFNHARDSASLERDSLALELRTKRLERERQALVVAALEARVAELTVRSPVDGMVASLAQPQKSVVPANAPLLTIVDLSALEIEFQVAETCADDIRRADRQSRLARGAPGDGPPRADQRVGHDRRS